jgi:transposase
VHGPVQIGENAMSLAVYLKSMNAISDERLVVLFSDVFGLKISEGWLENTLTTYSKCLEPTYNAILEEVKQSPVGGSDETGIRINGKGGYIWIFQVPEAWVYLYTAMSRAFKVVEETLGATFKGTHVSDRYNGQLKLVSNHKQFCLAHLIRDFRYQEEIVDCAFAKSMKKILCEAIAFRNEEEKKEGGYNPADHKAAILYAERRLEKCFLHSPPEDEKFKKSRSMYNTLKEKQECLLRFLHDPLVPPTNNDSERPLRHVTLFRKVSGGFRTLSGARRFDVFLSIIQSAKRQGLNVLQVIQGKLKFNFSPALQVSYP